MENKKRIITCWFAKGSGEDEFCFGSYESRDDAASIALTHSSDPPLEKEEAERLRLVAPEPGEFYRLAVVPTEQEEINLGDLFDLNEWLDRAYYKNTKLWRLEESSPDTLAPEPDLRSLEARIRKTFSDWQKEQNIFPLPHIFSQAGDEQNLIFFAPDNDVSRAFLFRELSNGPESDPPC